MKIKINVKEKHLNFTFFLPLAFMKSKLVYKHIFKGNNINIEKSTIDEIYKYLKKYKNLKKVYVELPQHKKLLMDYGIEKGKIEVTPTPSKIERKKA